DPNKERREAVKRKITQYLRRAEEIFNCHLQRAAGSGNPTATGYSSLRFRPIRTLSSAVENLRRCKVVGLIDKVQIVQDPATGATFILKSLPKSHVETRERQTIIPHGVPFMVKLLCYSVSEDSIFLHLEHVQGETLWSHLRSKYCVQQGSADSNTVQALRDLGREDGVGSSQGSSQASILSARTGVAPSSSAQPRGQVPVAWKPSRVAYGGLGQQPPSEQCEALASCGHGRRAWAVQEEQVQLWAAEILLALEGLHQQGVLCRDLNPRNLLLDATGHIRLTFFGQWTEVEPQCCSQAQEQLYSAPEVGGIAEPTEAADCWSFGSLLYELLTGVPLSQNHPSGIQPHTQLHVPEGLSLAATSLLTELLQYNPNQRLGSGGGGMAKLKSHSFFSTVLWNKLVG
ncbi:PREDICTED: ribosomal protein S6 kinase-like 1, partial [Nestor notabilis]|uniref:ribosomal protein S6 kinase-like 1 n=1 Tax=Nestor notabilis TaxID=176057 RepID=UPI0005231D9F